MNVGDKVYAVFQIQVEPPRYVIYPGKITISDRGMTTVDYGCFTYTHADSGKGAVIFEDLDDAENKLEELRIKAWF